MPERQTHDYIHRGTLDLFAALKVATGEVIAKTKQQHRAKDFVAFLREIDQRVSADLQAHVIWDNLSAHKVPAVKRWLARHRTSRFASAAGADACPPCRDLPPRNSRSAPRRSASAATFTSRTTAVVCGLSTGPIMPSLAASPSASVRPHPLRTSSRPESLAYASASRSEAGSARFDSPPKRSKQSSFRSQGWSRSYERRRTPRYCSMPARVGTDVSYSQVSMLCQFVALLGAGPLFVGCGASSRLSDSEGASQPQLFPSAASGEQPADLNADDPSVPTVLFPFGPEYHAYCNQGPASDPSHNIDVTRFAVDLASSLDAEAGVVRAGLDGVAYPYDECPFRDSSASALNDSECGAGFGNHVRLLTDSGEVLLYAHLSAVHVREGQRVSAGASLGIEGVSGRAGGRHLHFSVHRHGDPTALKEGPGMIGDSVPFVFSGLEGGDVAATQLPCVAGFEGPLLNASR